MEENISDFELNRIEKQQEKFIENVEKLKSLIYFLLFFGTALGKSLKPFLTKFTSLAIFCALLWNSKNDILRALAITGAVTILASWIGLVGCNK